MNDHIYCDDFGTIAVTGPIVRFELMVHSLTEKDSEGKPKSVVQQQIIMPIDGFLRAASRIQASVQDLEKKGIISRAPPKDTAKRS